MKTNLLLSDELLNAFVDNELEGADRERVIMLQECYPEVAKAIDEKRQLKLMVKMARRSEPESVPELPRKKRFRLHTLSIAASVFIFLFSGYIYYISNQSHAGYDNPLITYSEKSSIKDSQELLRAASQGTNHKFVFHLDSMNNESTAMLIGTLKLFLAASKKNNISPDIEVIATGPGIMLLTTGYSHPNIDHILSVSEQFSNVSIIACNTSLKRVQENTNSKLSLMKRAMLVDSGRQWIKSRKQQGWQYINI